MPDCEGRPLRAGDAVVFRREGDRRNLGSGVVLRDMGSNEFLVQLDQFRAGWRERNAKAVEKYAASMADRAEAERFLDDARNFDRTFDWQEPFKAAGDELVYVQ